MKQLSPGRARPDVVDLGLALAYAVVAATQLAWGPDLRRPAVAVLGTLVLAGCLLVRRRAPFAALVTGLVALQVEAAAGAVVQVAPYATLVCSYAIGRHGRGARARGGAVMVALGVLGFYAATGWNEISEPISVLCAWLAAWALGYSTRRRLEEEQLAREALRGRYVAEERTRIAGEMHDVVGHVVNLIVVQAGAARLSLDRDVETSRSLLLQMEAAGRDALTEFDEVLGTLGERTADPSLDPVGLARLPALVRHPDGSGLSIELRLDPVLAARLPRAIDLTSYRIVQEALTNALKHAGPCRVLVAVGRSGADLLVEVSDDGRTGAGPPGRGLAGVAERARRCGGTVEFGPVEGSGFSLLATLPLELQPA